MNSALATASFPQPCSAQPEHTWPLHAPGLLAQLLLLILNLGFASQVGPSSSDALTDPPTPRSEALMAPASWARHRLLYLRSGRSSLCSGFSVFPSFCLHPMFGTIKSPGPTFSRLRSSYHTAGSSQHHPAGLSLYHSCVTQGGQRRQEASPSCPRLTAGRRGSKREQAMTAGGDELLPLHRTSNSKHSHSTSLCTEIL